MGTNARQEQLPLNLPGKPSLFILSGPSGVGKDAVLNKLRKSSFPLKYVVTMTTRPRREKEQDGKDYIFASEEHFRKMLDNGGLLEHASVYGNLYGVPRNQVDEALANGQDVMVKVDVQGVDNIKRIMPESISIFLMPPSIEELTNRLTHRKTETQSALELRLRTASEEMKKMPEFDYAVMNRWGEIDSAVSDIEAIITAEKCRIRK
jgi:guanylate kinase